MSHITSLFKEKGSDCWWELALETLLPEEVLEKVRSPSVQVGFGSGCNPDGCFDRLKSRTILTFHLKALVAVCGEILWAKPPGWDVTRTPT